jgi:methyl-accepting chemotaxis protein
VSDEKGDEKPPRTYDDVMLPEPLRHLYQMMKQQAERSAAVEAETQKKFDFIIEQQAQLTASVGQLSVTVDKMAAKIDRTADGMSALRAIAEIQSGEIKDLADSVKAIDARQREADERARHTDERLNVLVGVVERIISERQDGKGGA